MQDGYAVNAADEADVDLEEGTGTESPEQIIAAVLTDVIEEIRSAPKAQRPAMLSAAAAHIGQMLQKQVIGLDEGAELLRQAALQSGLAAEIGLEAAGVIAETGVNAVLNGARNPVLVRRLSDVEPEHISWLWRGRLALGKLALLAGHPGVGKSQLAANLAAMVSIGANLPDGSGHVPQGSVLILSAEDDIADTLRPRLEAAGADLKRICILDAAPAFDESLRRRIDLKADIATLDRIGQTLPDLRLVIIDPLSAYVGGLDAHRQSAVRAMLQPVADFAARHNAAVIGITHLNKTGRDAMLRVSGSLAFVAAARAAYLVAAEPGSDRRLLIPLKNNLGSNQSSLAFRITRKMISRGVEAPMVVWEQGSVEISPDEALTVGAGFRQKDSALAEAKAVLRDILANGPLTATEVKGQATQAGIAPQTLRRARLELGITLERKGVTGGGGYWIWALPDEPR